MELFRFRVTRSVLAQPCAGLRVPPVIFEAGGTPGEDPAAIAARLAATGSLIDPGTLTGLLPEFSSRLAVRGDLVSPRDCEALLPAGWRRQVEATAWADLGRQLGQSVVEAFIKRAPPGVTEGLCRLLLVHDLLSALDSQARLPARRRPLQTAGDVAAAVSWRHVILPARFFPQNSNALLARQPGITDLFVVHDEWTGYAPGQLAAVINVLPGETLENRIRHSREIDTLTSTTTTTTTTQQTENSQTTSSTLSQSATNDASASIGARGQVEISGGFGPMHVGTSFGTQVQTSQSSSDNHASSTAYQTVQRSVKTVSQQVITVQSQRTITRDSTYDDHKLSNSGQAVAVGMYRWLNEIHSEQLVRYPNRFVVEFEVPEPGAWLRWALEHGSTADWDNPDPGPFRLAGATRDITLGDVKTNWEDIAQQWRIQGLSPPPPMWLTVSAQLTVNPNQQTQTYVELVTDDTVTVPRGYKAAQWTAQVIGLPDQSLYVTPSPGSDPPAPGFSKLWINVGGGDKAQVLMQPPAADKPNPEAISGEASGEVGGIDTGTIPVAAYAYTKFSGFVVTINIYCALTDAGEKQWVESTFDQVAAAYQALLDAFRQERDTRSQQPGGAAALAGPPELNQARAVSELRRLVIQDLLGTPFGGEPAVTPDPPDADTEPAVDLQAAFDAAPVVQFFEQAFEWENLVYICYPYYWARTGQWALNAISASADPDFDTFLNAGSARVVVPARPGFENLVSYFLYTGQIWEGSRPPAPDDPGYLSVAQEIQALERGQTDGTPVGQPWTISLPTTLLWAGDDPKTLPGAPAAPAPPAAAGQRAR